MRARPADATVHLWHRPAAARIQWACVLMQLLGEQSLEHLHLVLAGFQSVEYSRQVGPYVQAVRTARMLLGACSLNRLYRTRWMISATWSKVSASTTPRMTPLMSSM